MSHPPAFQLYAADFFMDTISWTSEEVGCYFRLLMTEWVNGPLPFSAKKLQKVCQMSSKKWPNIWNVIATKFVLNNEGNLINVRLEKTREKQLKYIKSQRESGLKGAEKKKELGIYPFEKSSEPSSEPSRVGTSDSASEKQALQSSSSSSNKDKERDIQLSVVLRDNSCFHLKEEKIASYQLTYPNINVRSEILKIIQWNEDNPTKRKTRAGLPRHINAWLSGAQGQTKNIEAAPKPREHKSDNLTDEQRRANMAKTKEIVGDWTRKRDINKIIGDKK